MSHLIQEYAKSCGVMIGKPIINPAFFPVPFEKYITIHHGDYNATYYDYWDEVLDILKPILSKNGIKIVQISDFDEQNINGADLHLKCSKKQSAFVIKNSLCHIGTDSIYCYFAGHFNKPLLAIYSHTNPKNTRPWNYNKSKTKFLISVLENERFSLDVNESPKTINKILPEDICKEVLALLKIKAKIKFKTLLIGDRFKNECIDIIPIKSCSLVHNKINVRMDICHNEDNLLEVLKRNTVEITTSNPISENILSLRKISVINYLSEEFDENFVKTVRSLGIHINLLCVSEKKLASQRFKFFDCNILFHDLESKIKENAEKFSSLSDKKIKTKSNKVIVIGKQNFFSYIEALGAKELFLLDLDWLYLYTDK